ncbi:hypothetical protein O0L34_g3055 [Tuta absoluta]|nr:hypothetical protein O0L34_g3055 [Tuta absoluta]
MGTMYKVAALILLATLSRGDLPEDDFRIITKEDLLATDSDIFEDNSAKSFSQLLFDVARDQVIVGARDALYRLSLRGLRQLERAEWPAPEDKAQLCQDKGQTEEDCHNYVKVLLSYGHKLFACGTNAFSPVCSWREIESISTVTDQVTGVANCPYNPHSNVTALLASSGEYYAGTPTDFAGSDTAICRSRGAALRDAGTVRTTQYDLNWLNEPQFVGSFEDDAFVYFVFREVAVEFMNCGKTIYSRIARVCKNDSGGHLPLDNWSTFLKARLTCSVPGEVPFYYDEVQSIAYLPQEKLIVAAFSTPSNSVAGSALCVYNMSALDAVFSGPYKTQETTKATWEPRAPTASARDHFRCVPDDRPFQQKEYNRYYLMHRPIQPISGEPVYKVDLQRFTHVTVDATPTESGRQLVAYVATLDDDIYKLAVLPALDGACLVEVLKLKDDKGGFHVLNMQFVKDTMSLYIGSETGVVRVSGERCGRRKSRTACTAAGDPHCAWHDTRETCLHDQDHLPPPTAACRDHSAPVDGGWSAWSEWAPCMQDGTANSAYGERPDLCMCRTRRCDSPRPQHGGKHCAGASISVSNCTVHGGWSAWSGWSECSPSCGIAVKSRRRSCTAPEPRFGGRVCVGIDSQDVFCSNLPPCPNPDLAPVDGGWSAWGPWSGCTSAGGAGCGAAAGWRERRRACNNPAPKNGGVDCDGSKIDRQMCDLRPCELRKATAWTPWVQISGNSSDDDTYIEKRFKFLCKAPSPEQLKLSMAREEERFCTSRGCSSAPPVVPNSGPDDGSWEAWAPWGPCSAPCGGGQQARTRRCRMPPCAGSKEMLRACNTQACSGTWSCWSEWSACSGGCTASAVGTRTRTRMCLSPEGCADAGAALERRSCIAACDDNDAGWGAWGAWTGCDNGERLRRRSCANDACVGAQVQVARTSSGDIDNELYALPAYTSNLELASFVTVDGRESLGAGGIFGCVFAAFVIGWLLCLASVVYCQRRGSRLPWSRKTRVPSSPHYITAKQNSYVTVPLKDVPRKAKRQPSFTGIGGPSGILLSKSNNINANNHNTAATPKLYPKAIANEYDSVGTLRRHSNQPNNKNNLDVEEDKFY